LSILTPDEEAELDWQIANDAARAVLTAEDFAPVVLMTVDELAASYDRAHESCRLRAVVCHDCGHYP
jgi:hypothetical protein